MSSVNRPARLAVTDPLVIDVEASGFGTASYPIEVGVALPGGKTHCMIIRPEPDWVHWDPAAEALHGISRDTLVQHGLHCKEVASALNHWLGGQLVYSDAWGNDSSWLALLFECAGIPQRFRLESLRSLMTETQMMHWHRVKDTVVETSGFQRHRASNDAWILQQTYLKTLAMPDAPEV